MRSKCTAPSGLKLAIGNDPLVKAIFTHSRPCPMYANLMQQVSTLTLCAYWAQQGRRARPYKLRISRGRFRTP